MYLPIPYRVSLIPDFLPPPTFTHGAVSFTFKFFNEKNPYQNKNIY